MAASVTVIGANGQTLTINLGTSSSAAVAQQLLANITAGLNSGAYLGVQDGLLPAIPAGVAGVVFDASNDGNAAPLQIPTDYLGFVNTSTLPITVSGNGGLVGPMSIFGGTGGFTYSTGNGVAGPGSGTISAGTNTVTGNQFNIVATSVAGGGYLVSLGDGTNTIAAAAGANTINGGAGSNLINVGTTLAGGVSSNDYIGLMGNDTVTASGGNGKDTIGVNPAFAGETTLISFASAWTGSLFFGNTSTVFGSAGTDSVNGGGGTVTLLGGLASTNFVGGTAGGNYIVDGQDHLTTVVGGGKSSVTGGGKGDQLFASSVGGGVIQAGLGNETLVGAGHSTAGYDKSYLYPTTAPTITGTVFFGSSLGGATSSVYVGAGADTVVAEGAMTVDGNAGKGGTDYYFSAAYTSVGGGARVTINDFTVGADTVALKGYTGSLASVGASATIFNGNTSISLSDGTTVTFNHVTTLFTDPTSKFTFG